MSDLLTPSINVPAERAKLRTLRNEIAADVAHREAHQRKYTARGFLRDVQPLEAQGEPRHGKAPHGALRAGASMGVSAASANLRPAQTRCCGRCSGSGGMGQEGLSGGTHGA